VNEVKEMDRKLKMGVGIGGPSIIMIFVVLCFTTLGALSLMTADADWKLTTKVAASVTDYYAADSKAEELLAAADAALKAGQPLDTSEQIIAVSKTQNMILKLAQQGSEYKVLYRKLVPVQEWDYGTFDIDFNDAVID
jgi:nucleotide-binding universal stress UspA family protein